MSYPWGEVFPGWARDGRAVVLHVIGVPPDVPGFAEQLLAELRPLLHLSHPAVVPYLDAGLREDGTVFLVTEPYADTDIFDWSGPIGGRRPVQPLAVLRAVARACDGVGALHRAGHIHGDLDHLRIRIEPGASNKDVEVKVLLPGLEPAWDAVWRKLTGDPQRFFGNPTYFAPERILSEPLTTAADCYSLGVVLFRCLSDGLLYSGHPAEKLSQPPARLPPCGLSPRSHAAVDALLQSMLAQSPEQRPQDVTAVAGVLRQVAAAERSMT